MKAQVFHFIEISRNMTNMYSLSLNYNKFVNITERKFYRYSQLKALIINIKSTF